MSLVLYCYTEVTKNVTRTETCDRKPMKKRLYYLTTCNRNCLPYWTKQGKWWGK